MEKGYIQIITTLERKKDAERIGNILIEKRLAACIQIIGPLKSIYRWKEKIELAEEWMCIIKTKDNLYEEIERCIRDEHPYEIPEVIAVPIIKGSRGYLEWLRGQIKINNSD